MIGVLGTGEQLWLHDGVTFGGEAQVLEKRTLAKGSEPVKSEILQSAVGTGVAKALIGGGARVIAARERKATRVTNSAAAKGGKAKGGKAEGGAGYGGKGGDANAEGGTGYGGDANAEASARAKAEADARAEAEATGIEINFPDDPCVTGDCD